MDLGQIEQHISDTYEMMKQRSEMVLLSAEANRRLSEARSDPVVKALYRGWWHGLLYAHDLLLTGKGKTELEWKLEES